MRRYLMERIAEKKEKLAELSNNSTPKVAAGYAIRDILSKLLVKEITGFTLLFQESKRLSCYGRLVRKTLILTVPEIRRHRDNYTLRKSHINYLKKLGFRSYNNKDKLLLFTPYSTVDEMKAVYFILARITFEVFYFKELVGESYIKYQL